MTNIRDFASSLLNVDSLEFKSNESIIYDIKYLKILNSSNSLYLAVNNSNAYFAKSGEKKCLIFASTDKNKMVLEDYTELWDQIKEHIELVSCNKVIKYSRDFMKIEFQSDDNL